MPEFKEEISSFEVEGFGRHYIQRLEAYFLAPIDGSYDFYLTCYRGCYLMIDDVYSFYHHIATKDSKWTR